MTIQPSSTLPANPTKEERIAYALYGVMTAAAGALGVGATADDIEVAASYHAERFRQRLARRCAQQVPSSAEPPVKE